MIKRFFNKSDSEDKSRIEQAKRQKQLAKKEHEEALQLIKLLDIERKNDSFGNMLEKALKAERGSA